MAFFRRPGMSVKTFLFNLYPVFTLEQALLKLELHNEAEIKNVII